MRHPPAVVLTVLAWLVPAAAPAAEAEPTCTEIYNEISALLTRTPDYHRSVLEDPRAQAAGAAATVYPPAVALVGVAAVLDFKARRDSEAAAERIVALRELSADRQCWVR